MSKTVSALRKLIVLAIGLPVLVLGIILIPLPGPGLLICFLSFLILSVEFEWAKEYRDKLRVQFKKLYDSAKERADKIENYGDKPKDKKSDKNQ